MHGQSRFAQRVQDRRLAMSNNPPTKVPIGPAITWSDDDLDALSEITPADERRASARATEEMRALVNAPTEEPKE